MFTTAQSFPIKDHMHAKSYHQERVALVYDRVNTFGGAERVLQVLHAIYPGAPLYTSVYDPRRAPWAHGWDVRTSFLQRMPFFRSRHEFLGFLMPLAFESFDFSMYDLVISVTSEAAKGIITKPGTRHVCYLLTPTRYLWHQQKEHEHSFLPGMWRLFLPLYHFAIRSLQKWDRVAATRPDEIIPISKTVQRRCEQYYARKTLPPLFPPVEAEKFSRQMPSSKIRFQYPFYLCVSRLVRYKRIDLAISACKRLKRHLVVIGKGRDERRLRAVAGNSSFIHFLGHLTDQELVRYYQQCSGVLFPGEEDFGLTALEAMAAGKPVIVYEKSGCAEVIRQGKTGLLFTKQTEEALAKAVLKLETIQWNAQAIQEYAKKYDVSAFVRQWKGRVCMTTSML